MLFEKEGLSDVQLANIFNEHFVAIGAASSDVVDKACEQFM